MASAFKPREVRVFVIVSSVGLPRFVSLILILLLIVAPSDDTKLLSFVQISIFIKRVEWFVFNALTEFWHMAKVLRLKAEDMIELSNGNGGLVEGCIQSLDKTGVDFFAQEDQEVILPPQGIQWQVFAAFGTYTLKSGRADWLIEQCTELGASSATPVLTENLP
ncbi:hypothetical protein IGI04_019131 [Brassica rapa subsp. trilocularis]|uniref:Ribosomal RNA small subunit methyltransferase E PUA-like domain-containing protein n=1 Tax=Brassica rapa subsp. trilocularis TaxID=1813537 RepID=A0ABQ7MFB2_BRACM|nr:hypothetical protein IGI04_019131 [Brassica rapa subsp. trilocularis]